MNGAKGFGEVLEGMHGTTQELHDLLHELVGLRERIVGSEPRKDASGNVRADVPDVPEPAFLPTLLRTAQTQHGLVSQCREIALGLLAMFPPLNGPQPSQDWQRRAQVQGGLVAQLREERG